MSAERIKHLFEPKTPKIAEAKNAVIYTRVSTQKQVDNTSLGVQLERCREFCVSKNLKIIKEFGGTYESAKNDEDRKVFSQMVAFVKEKKNNVGFIVTLSPDRFSRSGGDAIMLIRKLYELNIKVLFVTQGVDDTSPSGRFVRDMQFLLSNLDNETRKEKVTTGMIARLRQGYFPFGAPLGYSSSEIPGLKVPNEKAKFIKLAFELKSQGYSHDQIVSKLDALGFNVSIKKLSAIYLNPFYCGVVSSSLIEEGFVDGKHEAIISTELFEEVNCKKASYNTAKMNISISDRFPLNRFITCSQCGKKWTKYIQKKIGYYKCNTRGCRCNRSASSIHTEFANKLKDYVLPDIMVTPLKEQLKLQFKERNVNRAKELAELESRLADILKSIEKVKLRFAKGEINEDVYETALSHLIKDESQTRRIKTEAEFQL